MGEDVQELNSTTNIDNMLTGKPLKLLLKLGVPAVVMALTDELNSFIDAIFMGQYFGSDAVSSMSIVLPVMLFMVAFAMLLSDGTSTAAGRYLGAKNLTKANEYFTSTVVLTVISGAAIGVAFYFLVPSVLNLFDITQGVRYYADIYLRVLSLGMPIFLTVLVLGRMVYTEGKNTFLLVTTIIQLVLNAVINFVLIGVLRIGVMGAALGTLLAELIQIVLLVRYINSDKMNMKLSLKHCWLDKAYFKEVFGLGMPTFLSMILLSVTFGIESRVIAGFGAEPLSVQTITGYIFSISSSVASGIMGVSLVILSYSVGAKDLKRFMQTLKISTAVVFGVVVFINMILLINSDTAVKIFTNAQGVIDLIQIPALVYGLTAPFIFTTNVVLYAMQPVGMEKTSTLLFALQQVLLFVPLLFVFKGFGFVYAVSAQPTSEVIGGIITLVILPLFIKKTKRYFALKEDF